jgi:hypothetical protein
MLSTDSQEYIERWNIKVALIVGNGLAEVFEKFSSLYKIFGRLFNDVSEELVSLGTISKKGGDQKSATENVIQYLSADEIINAFQVAGNNSNIMALIGVLPHFNIKFTNSGQHEPQVDAQLLHGLQSTNNYTKALSILLIIYFVRCNYEHSRKSFDEDQRFLLEPLINLLQTLNHQLLSRLSN